MEDSRPAQAGEVEDWRSLLPPDARQRIVNKILDTLKRHFSVSDEEGLNDLKKVAVRFEEKVYVAADSQSDYLRKISLKMLSMETKNSNGRSLLPSSSRVPSYNPSNSG